MKHRFQTPCHRRNETHCGKIRRYLLPLNTMQGASHAPALRNGHQLSACDFFSRLFVRLQSIKLAKILKLCSMKYIVVSGGVISGIGKGTIVSALGFLLKASGMRVTAIKIDPYINIDAGTLSPLDHGKHCAFCQHVHLLQVRCACASSVR